MARKAAANWVELKQEYISNAKVTYQGLADKYGVSARSVKRHAIAEKWVEARKDVVRKVTENVTQKVVDDLDEINERHTKAYRNLQAFALTNLNILYDHIKTQVSEAKLKGVKLNPRDVYNSQQAKFLAETLRLAMDGERITLGLPTVVTKGEQDVNIKNEFADKPMDELERLYKALDAPNETDTAPNRQG